VQKTVIKPPEKFQGNTVALFGFAREFRSRTKTVSLLTCSRSLTTDDYFPKICVATGRCDLPRSYLNKLIFYNNDLIFSEIQQLSQIATIIDLNSNKISRILKNCVFLSRYFGRDRTSAWENQMGMIGTFDAKNNSGTGHVAAIEGLIIHTWALLLL